MYGAEVLVEVDDDGEEKSRDMIHEGEEALEQRLQQLCKL